MSENRTEMDELRGEIARTHLVGCGLRARSRNSSIDQDPDAGTRSAQKGIVSATPQPQRNRIPNMTTITTLALSNVHGGKSSKSSELTTALASIQSSIKDVASSKNSGGLDSTTFLMLGLMMSQNKSSGPTVVAGAAAPAVVAGGPQVNISTRIRRW
jgi:hypothetical protein